MGVVRKSTHNGREIPYILGVILGFDQFCNALIPGADIDKTISHRLGVAMVEGRLSWARKPFAMLIYTWLERIDRNHSIDSIGY